MPLIKLNVFFGNISLSITAHRATSLIRTKREFQNEKTPPIQFTPHLSETSFHSGMCCSRCVGFSWEHPYFVREL